MAATGGHWIKSARGSKLDFVPAGGRPEHKRASALAALDARIIENTRQESREWAYIMFSDGAISEEIRGDRSSITPAAIEQVIGQRSMTDAVLTHTHPGSVFEFPSTFSYSDIVFAAYHNMAEIRALSPVKNSNQVRIYTMKRGPKGWPDYYMIHEQGTRFMERIEDQSRRGVLSHAQWFKAREVFWQEYAKAYELTYEERWQ